MSEKRIFKFVIDSARRLAAECCMTAPNGWVCRIEPPTRTLDQNARMWSLLTEVSRQVEWHGRKLSAEDWKHIFTSSIKKMDVVPNLEGNGFVVLGLSTSKMSKRELSDLMDLICAFAVDKGVDINEVA